MSNRINGTHGNDHLIGTSSNDQIGGSKGNDVLEGLGGKDRLSGGEGNDDLYGGAGNDTFVFGRTSREGHDTVHDWNHGDRIDVAGDYSVQQVGSDVVITNDHGATMTVLGVQMDDLNIV